MPDGDGGCGETEAGRGNVIDGSGAVFTEKLLEHLWLHAVRVPHTVGHIHDPLGSWECTESS